MKRVKPKHRLSSNPSPSQPSDPDSFLARFFPGFCFSVFVILPLLVVVDQDPVIRLFCCIFIIATLIINFRVSLIYDPLGFLRRWSVAFWRLVKKYFRKLYSSFSIVQNHVLKPLGRKSNKILLFTLQKWQGKLVYECDMTKILNKKSWSVYIIEQLTLAWEEDLGRCPPWCSLRLESAPLKFQIRQHSRFTLFLNAFWLKDFIERLTGQRWLWAPFSDPRVHPGWNKAYARWQDEGKRWHTCALSHRIWHLLATDNNIFQRLAYNGAFTFSEIEELISEILHISQSTERVVRDQGERGRFTLFQDSHNKRRGSDSDVISRPNPLPINLHDIRPNAIEFEDTQETEGSNQSHRTSKNAQTDVSDNSVGNTAPGNAAPENTAQDQSQGPKPSSILPTSAPQLQINNTNLEAADLNKHFVLLGVPKSSTWTPTSIPLNSCIDSNTSQHCDELFTRRIRTECRRLRGWLRSYLSIYRLKFCHCAKFDKCPADGFGRLSRVGKVAEELPPVSRIEYTYIPRPPADPYQNPFSVENWGTRLYQPEQMRCRCGGRRLYVLPKMPKRDGDFPIKDPHSEEDYFWGVSAEFRPWVVMVLLYEFLFVLVGGGAYYCYSMTRDPQDQQDAVVPMMLALAVLSSVPVSIKIESMQR